MFVTHAQNVIIFIGTFRGNIKTRDGDVAKIRFDCMFSLKCFTVCTIWDRNFLRKGNNERFAIIRRMNKQIQKQQAFNSYESVFRKYEMVIVINREKRRCRSKSDINYISTKWLHNTTHPRIGVSVSHQLKSFPSSQEFYFKSFPDILFWDILERDASTHICVRRQYYDSSRVDFMFSGKAFAFVGISSRKRISLRMNLQISVWIFFPSSHGVNRKWVL